MKLEINNLRHRYPSGEEALKGINLTLEGTTPVAIVGQNGSGKTTLVKHFNRILSPTDGEVLIDGVSTKDQSTAKWSKRVGYVFQNPDDQLFLSTVRKEFEFGPRCVGISEERIAEMLPQIAALCGLENKLDQHPFDLNATEKKFCTIGSVMMMDPDAIVFDEPTCGQDIAGNRRLAAIVQHLRGKDKLCITISHDMKFVVANFERVVVLCQGTVLMDDTREAVFSQPEILRKSFVSPPPVTRVSLAAGFDCPIFTVSDLIGEIESKSAAKSTFNTTKGT